MQKLIRINGALAICLLMGGVAWSGLRAASVPYFQDFEGVPGAEWTTLNLVTEEPLYFTRCVGRAGAQTLTLEGLTPGQSYRVWFDLYIIDAWDGGNTNTGDLFMVHVNGTNVFRHAFANFNNNPPSGTQTFPRQPDEGRMEMGFNFSSGYLDAIYRSVEVTFAPTGSVAVIVFNGANLQAGVETWAIDNVEVRPATEAANTILRSTTLPPHQSTNALALRIFTLAATQPLSATSATNAANWSLREAGVNGAWGDGDDVVVPLSISLAPFYQTGRSVGFNVVNPPLPPGRYRFQSGAGLVDTNGVPVPVFTRDFVVTAPYPGVVETAGNDTPETATPLSLVETPPGLGLLTAAAVGQFDSLTDVDFYRFDAEAGDRLTVRVECQGEGASPRLQLQNLAGSSLASVNGNYAGVANLQQYQFASAGTYYLRVWSTARAVPYAIRVDLGRQCALESEANNTTNAANAVTYTQQPGVLQSRLAGSLPAEDDAGDYFALGRINAGNAVTVVLRFPDGSSLRSANTQGRLFLGGDTNGVAVSSGDTLNYTIAAEGDYFLQVASSNRAWRSQYVLDILVADSVRPVVASTTLPAEGAGTAALWDRFSLAFSEPLLSASVTNTAHYELRGAGPDNQFNTGDDELYTVICANYGGALAADYLVPDGPLQPGLARLTVTTNLADRAGNPLMAFVRTFNVTNPPGYVMESRYNNIPARSSFLTSTPGLAGDGTFSSISAVGNLSNPYLLIAADVNRDSRADLLVPNNGNGTVLVLTNRGNGVFQTQTNLGGFNGPWALAAGRFGAASNFFLAVVNNNLGTLTIVVETNGVWTTLTNLSGFNRPAHVIAGDWNGDGHQDLAVANYNGANLRVVLGNGDGTFQPGTNYAVGTQPIFVAAGDVNGDGRQDLVAANASSGSFSLLLGNGDGSFQTAQHWVAGGQARAVAVAEVTGDNQLDVVVYSATEGTVSVFAGNGDGTFATRRTYGVGAFDAYQLVVADINQDNTPEIIVPSYTWDGFVAVLYNMGSGIFGRLQQHSFGIHPIGVAVADYNGDNIQDLAVTTYYGNQVEVVLGNPVAFMVEDPPGSGLRSGYGRGNISDANDIDYFRLTGQAGDQVQLAIENLTIANGTGLRVDLYTASGQSILSFTPDWTGWGQSGIGTLPYTGTYLVSVRQWYEYRGEYRLRVSMARPPLRFEVENNNTQANAQAPAWTLTNGVLVSSLAGYLSQGDAAGDWFRLGRLSPGATLQMDLGQPAVSGFSPVISVINGAGQLVTNSPAGVTNFQFVVPASAPMDWFVRLTGEPGAPAFELEGQANNALYFSGGQYVRIPDSPSLRPVNFTLEGWVNFTALNYVQHLFAKTWGAGTENSYVVWYEGGALRAYLRGGPALVYNWTPELGRWYHVAFVFDDAANTQVLYLDGNVVASGTVTASTTYDSHPLLLGADFQNENVTDFLVGKLDEVRLWSVARTAGEIAADRLRRLNGDEAGLVGFWRLNEGTGLMTADATANGNHGTLVNNPIWIQSRGGALPPMPVMAQYVATLTLAQNLPLTLVANTLPPENATVSNIWNYFTLTFSQELGGRINTMNRIMRRLGSSVYLLTDNSGSWDEAQAAAQAVGGNLATVNDAAENQWLWDAFKNYGDLWIGLNDKMAEGAFQWASGQPYAYTNWMSGRPNNNGGAYGVFLDDSTGQWSDSTSTSLRGIIELPALPDSDGDGIPDAADAYPNDLRNGVELRGAGADNTFDTADDEWYDLDVTSTSGGLSLGMSVVDGPLQPGRYRLTVTTAVTDRFGNPLNAAHTRFFTVADVPGLFLENRNNNTPATATTLSGSPGVGVSGSLMQQTNLAAGTNPRFPLAADVNADGRLDLLVGNHNNNTFTVWLGLTNGGWLLLTNHSTPGRPMGMALADFNRDGQLDLAVANYSGNSLQIRLGAGTGLFPAFTNYTTPAQPYYLAVADFNKDNFWDIALANLNGNNISIFAGNGDGTFQPRTDIALGSGAFQIAAGDLNGDGNADLVVVCRNANTLNVLLGNGTGGFAAPASYNLGTTGGGLALGDMNEDGVLDAVVTAYNTLKVYPGLGDGAFATPISMDYGGYDNYHLLLHDLDGDGRQDILIPEYGNARMITVANLGGSLGAPLIYNFGGRPVAVAKGDFNQDGRMDFAVANWDNNSVQILTLPDAQNLVLDNATGARYGGGRGTIVSSSDVDFWSFSGLAGDLLALAIETPEALAEAGLNYRLFGPDGQEKFSYYSDYNGFGNYSYVLPGTGNYTLRVANNYQYRGEYRFRLTLARPPVQLEAESNNDRTSANALSFRLSEGRQSAAVMGYAGRNDPADLFRLGNLSENTLITLQISRPASSGFTPQIALLNAAGQVVTNVPMAATHLAYVVPAGGSGAYFAQLRPGFPARSEQSLVGLAFDGDNDYVNAGGWSPGTRWTVHAWVQLRGYQGGRRGVVGAPAECRDWGLVTIDGRFAVNVRPPGGCGTSYVAGGPFPEPGQWYHVAGACDGTNAYLYVNGELAASGPVDVNYVGAANGVWLGGEVCCGNYFGGLIQGAGVWNRMLSAAEIQSLMTAAPSGNESGLMAYWPLNEGSGTTVTDISTNARHGTLVNGPEWLTLGPPANNAMNLMAHYRLNVELVDTQPPFIVGVTLPPEGASTNLILDRFTLQFSEDMSPGTVQAATNYLLVNAGADEQFGTADDFAYTVVNSPAYASGTSASFLITDGPLQPGWHRLVVTTNLADTTGLRMSAPFARQFHLANMPGYVLENRANNSMASATSLSTARTNRPAGSFSPRDPVTLSGRAEYLAVGHLNGDAHWDLVVPIYENSTVAVYTGAGNGTFQLRTNFSAGNGALTPLLLNLNGDAHLDLVVGNYGANTLSVYLGNGDATFAWLTNYATGQRPYGMVAGDFNGDGRQDVVSANFNSSTISVFLGNGDGTFQPQVTYPAGNGAMKVAAGDLNGDGRLDVVCGDHNAGTLSVFINQGNGTFAPRFTLGVHTTLRSVAVADMDGDGALDILSGHDDGVVNWFRGQGNGTFLPRVSVATGAAWIYSLLPVDYNGDGRLDLALSDYYNHRVVTLLNAGQGQFEPASRYGFSGSTYFTDVKAGDFNGDGRMDLVGLGYESRRFQVWLQDDVEWLNADGPQALTSLARGKLFDSNDQDYWSFYGQAGDRVQVAIETVGNPAASGLYVVLLRPDGSDLLSYGAGYYGSGAGTVQLPVSGRYTVRVTRSYDYFGEYRLRLSLLKPPTLVESEDNWGVNTANSLAFTAAPGRRSAQVFGSIHAEDNQDFFRLGNLSSGTFITLVLNKPSLSQLQPVLAIFRGDTQVAIGGTGETNLFYLVPEGGEGAYYARVSAAGGTQGLLAHYFLDLALNDITPPRALGSTLPTNGSVSTALWDGFSVTVNKDVDVAGLAGLGSLRLRSGHAYFFTASGLTWRDAQTQALARGGHLVTINDAEENAWILANFGSDFFIGLNDENEEGVWGWASGEPVTYLNWNGGEPNNAGNEDYVQFLSNGRWNDVGAGHASRGLVEVGGPDSDGDGLPDAADPYPNNTINLIDLRSSGPDGQFDTADDEIYRLLMGSYSGGSTLSFSITDGPLQPGAYRLRITTDLRDTFGNTANAPYEQYFRIENLPGFNLKSRTNFSVASADALQFQMAAGGVRVALARGKRYNDSDTDYYRFTGSTGEVVSLAMDVPGNPGASTLRYQVLAPDGTVLQNYDPSYYGDGVAPLLTLNTNGQFTVVVSQYYSFLGEYQFRVAIAPPPAINEFENNGAIISANALTLAAQENQRVGYAFGMVNSIGELDYFYLGYLTNGSTVFLLGRTPGGSSMAPAVSLYNASGQLQNEVTGGNSGDAAAEVRITADGHYYALVRGTTSAAGLRAYYVLEARVVPTGTVTFPNLVVSSVILPAGTPLSGQTIQYAFTVVNTGTLVTAESTWFDRAVLSTNTVLGDADDIPLGFFPHLGALTPGQAYTVSNSFRLPDGISGGYYLIVQTDSGDAVNEFLFESDNLYVSPTTFTVQRAPYPDLKIEGLSLTGPDGNGVYTFAWNTANRGTAPALGGFHERFFVRRLPAGVVVTNVELAVNQDLAVNATVPGTFALTATNPGDYRIEITTDARNAHFEFDALSHASAEANVATTNFVIVQIFPISVAAQPPGAGVVGGGGNYAQGATVTVTAQALTNELPYFFVNWTENGVFQSASTNYSFVAARSRQLVANFSLPSYLLLASNSPAGAGVVAGQGTFFHGTTNVLTALPNLGYGFSNWTENGVVVGLSTTLTNIALSNRWVVANYYEANPFHVVTTATFPTNVAEVGGAGTFLNGESASFTAPAAVTNPPNIYLFREWRLSNVVVSASRTFNRLFTTQDPTNLHYVAHYDSVSIQPLITNVWGSFPNPVPATTNFIWSAQFNRSMDPVVMPLVVFSNRQTTALIPVAGGGRWQSLRVSNDTYTLPAVTFATGADGTYDVWVSLARDVHGVVMAPTNAGQVVVDVTAPPLPQLVLSSSNSSSVTFQWTAYAAPADVAVYRAFIRTTNFSNVTGLPIAASLAPSARSYTFGGLALDTTYYAAVVPVDVAGNFAETVQPFVLFLPSTVPPPVAITVNPTAADAAQINWSSYQTAGLFGFAGFRLFYETNAFSTVAGLTPRETLGLGARSASVTGLDRRFTYYFAVVGYNATNGFHPSVTTATWSDPFAGNITANMTLGGAGQVVEILQPMTVLNDAVLTVPAGTTVRFAPGAGITVSQGRLLANGTALDPVVFTSMNDVPGGAPMPGDWEGITLGAGAGNSVLRHVFVRFGRGLVVDGSAPLVEAFTGVYNQPAGLRLRNGAGVDTSEALLAFNGYGAWQSDTSTLKLRQSVVKNNATNAWNTGSQPLVATQVWWGSAVAGEVTAGVAGLVTTMPFLTGEPLLTPAVGISNNVTQVGYSNVLLRLACRTADAMRLSEDSIFVGVFYESFAPWRWFALSEGGGAKTIYAQFRSVTGNTSAPVSLTITYLTQGPVISSFNLTEGQVIGRPLLVTGAASAPLGMATMEFYVNNAGVATNVGGSLNHWWDVRAYSNGIHRVKLLARDTAGRIATLERNVAIAPVPPPAPAITSPGADMIVTSNQLALAGTAEPNISLRLLRNGALVGETVANAQGQWSLPAVLLVEGDNVMVASAFDSLGAAASPPRRIVLDSGPPTAPILQSPTYYPGRGVEWTWQFAPTGERPTRFRLFWHTAPFATPTQASGQSPLIVNQLTYMVPVMPAGSLHVAVVGYDDAGNASPLSNLVPYTHDPNPPSFTIAFDKASPVGTGPLRITLAANEPLAETPSVTLNYGSGPITLTVSNVALNTYAGTLLVGPFTPSRPVSFNVSGRDLAGNVFNGAPSGPNLVIDVTPPVGSIVTVPVSPVQVTNITPIQVQLKLSEAMAPGATPQLAFTPPAGGAPIPIPLTGADSNWSGTLTLTPAAGSGFGQFTLTAVDALDNVGNGISQGASMEIYNSALPTPPAAPAQIRATSLSGGYIRLEWAGVSNAEIYRVYADAGSNGVPQTLVADNVETTIITNLPPADGAYRIAVSASRRGAEGGKSLAVTAISDRTPPPAPTNVTVQLVANGLRIAWEPGVGEGQAQFRVYRNGTLLRVLGGGTNIIDVPPRGVLSYVVGALDALGNEALSQPAVFEMLVGAVKNLEVVHNFGQAPILTWEPDDTAAVGYNVYRNGVKQNASPLTTPAYTDGLGVPRGGMVTYAVRAVNATNAESVARMVEVHDVSFLVMANLLGGAEAPPVTRYFDAFQVTVFNRNRTAPLPMQAVELRRVVSGLPTVTRSNVLAAPVPPNAQVNSEVVLPSSPVPRPQMILVRALQQPHETGGQVTYQTLVDYVTVVNPEVMVELSAAQPPLAGGLATLNLRVHNRGFADLDVVTARAGGTQPGDLTIAVRNHLGQEVNRVAYVGMPSGAMVTPDGTTLLRIPPGTSRNFQVDNILVPDSLGTNLTTFEAVFSQIYYRYGAANQATNGPIGGQLTSSLRLTPYYGVLNTDKTNYSNDDPVIISGQARDRQTGQPRPNAPLKIGFSLRGFKFYHSVTSDFSGNFVYEYQPPPGLSGRLKLWAAHPDVFDVLNQAEIAVYRAYFSPVAGDVRMTKNDTLTFNITLVNPGDEDLSRFVMESEAWAVVGTNLVPITNLTASAGITPDFVIGPRENIRVPISITATLDAPDNARMRLRLRSAEGAAATFDANLTLLPANPVLTVIDPPMGYVDVSVNRGQLLSRTFTVANQGMRDLLGVTLQGPTNIPWMTVNLAPAEDGKIYLPDLRVGQSNTITVVFTPPANTPLEYFQDRLILRGTNSPAEFSVNLYALVTSSSRGNVRFVVDNILAQRVPDATVRIKNSLLQIEQTYKTDANGELLIENLQEGPWAWQVLAPGHAAEAGRVEIVPNQTVLVEPRLSRSLVTVNFIVTPVPFTDRYEITIEQTFQTHVPVPVLVMTPPQYEFFNIEAGFEATVVFTVKNHGLVRAFDLIIQGGADGYATSTPLINYVPELGAMQSIDIPFRFYYGGRGGTNTSGLTAQFTRSRCLTSRAKCFGRDIDENGNIRGGVEFPPGYGQPTPGDCTGGIFDIDNFAGALMAIVNACAQCPDLKTIMSLATKGIKKYTEKAKFYNAIEGVILAYRLLGCPTPPGGPGSYGGGGGGGGGGGPARGYSDYGTGGGCFVAGTEVLLADGRWVSIETITTNQMVRTGTDPREAATVVEIAEREAPVVMDLHLNNGRVLSATPEHQIWVEARGWTFANQITAGDWLMNSSGRRVKVLEVRRQEKPVKVYTLVNREDHALFANDVLVRDGCGDKTPFYPWLLPLERAGAASPPVFPEGKEVAP
ncbi:FG-GAP-like repeat-containing protein [Fontisphaera persica]|uniref:FG-GAP-like repeat-containing protein n=1 Tax=Fontisphaera persica TaxID=2974023 RepID=UPI0024BF17EB|nr:FG-GAP-like repeat-containing protein [Fontisphaera persica]WCJ60887.1 FG-GAP-like repeat-containing protein [Fontisphaera persica]